MFFHTYTHVFPSSKLEPPQRTNMSNVFFPTFTTKLIVILLAWPSIKPGPSCLSKTKRWSTQTHIFKNNNAIENILTETGDLPPILSALNQNSSPGLQRQLAFPDKKPEMHWLPKNVRGKYLRKKKWVSRNDHASPMRNWPNDTKTTKTNHQHYKRQEHAGRTVPTVFRAVLKSTGSARVRLSPWTFASSGDSLDKHSYIGLAPSTFLPALLAFVYKLSTQ